MKKYLSTAILIMILLLLAVAGLNKSRQLREKQLAMGLAVTGEHGLSPDYALSSSLLGGLRGVLIQFLWTKARLASQAGDYYEVAELYNLISRMQPQHQMAWIFQAWDMSYNIAASADNAAGRLFWLWKGFDHLRLTANQRNIQLPELDLELSTMFRHKLAEAEDDSGRYFQTALANQMERLFAGEVSAEEQAVLLQQAAPELTKALLNETGLEIELMQRLNQTFGNLDWRTADAHALYWAVRGYDLALKQERFDWRYERSLVMAMAGLVSRGQWRWLNEEQGGMLADFSYFPQTMAIVSAIVTEKSGENQGQPRELPLGLANAVDYYLRKIATSALKAGRQDIVELCQEKADLWLNR